MKESDARMKICPIIREHHKVNDGFYCYGSDCAMWDSHEWTYQGKVVNPDEGDCGLKGKLSEVSINGY